MTPEVVVVPWDDEQATRLRTAQQAELRARYGDDDTGHTMTGDGIAAMVVVRDDLGAGPVPVACVALRDASNDAVSAAESEVGSGIGGDLGVGIGVGEVKRLYTVPEARGRGHARRAMLALELAARERGWSRLVLETGVLQPEAIGLYLTLGYTSIPNYGEYADEPSSRCFAKDLRSDDRAAAGAGARAGAGRRAARQPPVAARSVELETVAWEHPDAIALRRAMGDFNADRYPELVTVEADGGFATDDARQGVGILTTWLARIDGTLAGCLSVRAPRAGYPDGSVELKKLYVSESARGAGVARALLAAAHGEARSLGARTTVLATGIRQPEAVSLYLSSGYRPVLPYTDPTDDVLTLWFARPVF